MKAILPEINKANTAREINRFIKGIIFGIVVITPVSGGTFLLILGIYEELMRDLSSLNIMRWLSFGAGTSLGIVLSGIIFMGLFERYTLFIVAFLFGCILASIRSILGEHYRPNTRRITVLIAGMIIGLFLASISEMTAVGEVDPGMLYIMLGGALSSLAMILPGVPGGVILILMGIFTHMMQSIAELDIPVLFMFLIGSIIGILTLANILNKLYEKHKPVLSWLFVGLVLGSGRMLLPFAVEGPVMYFIYAIIGFIPVWIWTNKNTIRQN